MRIPRTVERHQNTHSGVGPPGPEVPWVSERAGAPRESLQGRWGHFLWPSLWVAPGALASCREEVWLDTPPLRGTLSFHPRPGSSEQGPRLTCGTVVFVLLRSPAVVRLWPVSVSPSGIWVVLVSTPATTAAEASPVWALLPEHSLLSAGSSPRGTPRPLATQESWGPPQYCRP